MFNAGSKLFPGELILGAGNSFREISTKLSGLLGRQPRLPNWLYNGVILGVQGGTEAMLGYLKQAKVCKIIFVRMVIVAAVIMSHSIVGATCSL